MSEFRLDDVLQRDNFRLDEALLKKLWSQKNLSSDSQYEINFTIVLFNYEELPSKADVERAIDLALRDLHGLVGASQKYELSSYDFRTQTGVLLFSPQAFKKLWSAVTLIKELNAVKCIFVLNDLKKRTSGPTISSQLIVT